VLADILGYLPVSFGGWLDAERSQQLCRRLTGVARYSKHGMQTLLS
jgi:hypothetical protein